ncbi:hypothetical protein [Paracoccus sp. KR1-242]|uniref:hypothetical protein n=1 Tax=Paracoccus sp. KR1-242 TaxID=3410028 RepID=UPI003BFEA884
MSEQARDFWTWFDANAERQANASKVVEAVLDCDPDDRIRLLETILNTLRPGMPQFVVDELVVREAKEWVQIASMREQKAMLFAIRQSWSDAEMAPFLDWAQPKAAA